MLLNVLKFPDKRLKQISKEIKEVNKNIEDLIEGMFETMYVENGIGLAAPQVGELIRLVVLDVPIVDEKNPKEHHPDPIALINPVIKSKQGNIEFEEGCLSCPELLVTVPRAEMVKVAYLNTEGQICELAASGLKAVCIQHEIDHLNGLLLVDKISRLERDFYKTKRIRLAKEEKDFTNVL
ncbi:MAG: hypothetical protein ACD_73C00724G0006 [uncultured bacterium]|nr:MAG: hypothetical protein ACD_73C00724G0006 [uncultured bacterium]